jgi:hypothetical protein
VKIARNGGSSCFYDVDFVGISADAHVFLIVFLLVATCGAILCGVSSSFTALYHKQRRFLSEKSALRLGISILRGKAK